MPKKKKPAPKKKTKKTPKGLLPLDIKSTAQIKVPTKTISQVIGQEKGVEIIEKAARQRRNVFLLGEPGTGKSMLGLAMAELLPVEKLQDILVYPNLTDPNQPKIKTVKAGQGQKIVEKETGKSLEGGQSKQMVGFIAFIFLLSIPWILLWLGWLSELMAGASLIVAGMLGIGVVIGMQMKPRTENSVPKVIVDNAKQKHAPFIEATGAKAGALLGDVKHDPLQCIPANALIHTPNGRPITAEQLIDPFFRNSDETELTLDRRNKFKVLSGHDSSFGFTNAIVNKLFRRHFEGDLIKLTTRRGYSIEVTPNHPIAIFNGKNVEYVEAAGVLVGMRSVVPDRLSITAKQKLPLAKALFYADILADGCVSDRSVFFKLRRAFKIKQIEKDARTAGFSPRVLKRGKNTFIYINSAEFVRYLKSIKLIENGRKRLPPIIFDQSKETITAFVSRFLSLDGYVNKSGQIELISKELIPDFIPLLLKVGIKARYRPRKDPGFGQGKLQPRIFFQDYHFLKGYAQQTINPIHKRNLRSYLKETSYHHVVFDDVIPVSFDWLEKIRVKTGLSKTKVHDEYYALNQELNSSKLPTRFFLQKVTARFMQYVNDPLLFKLRDVVEGTYAFDEIVSVESTPYKGFVYNMTTDTGTYLLNNVLTHNSGGLGTPPHLRVISGMIHRAHMGVLFIDEVATLSPKSQQELLTAMQEKKFSITGQSEMSSGAMVHTEPAPCNFVLVAAGNLMDLKNMHPALRSRIRGYGYEIYLNDKMVDTKENRIKIAQFVAQEVKKDGKIPHFSKAAVEEIIREAQKRAGRKGKLTVKLRELGGLVRAAGDIAKASNAKLVEPEHIVEAKKLALTMEQQLADKYISQKKEYEVFSTSGKKIGKVNGLAVMGDGGIVLPIEAGVAPAHSKSEGKLIATGKLGEIAKEAVTNVSAIIKKYKGTDISRRDIHVQFLQTYEGVEGDSASVSVATALISALENLPVDQSIAMTGSLSVRGEVLPVGGITPKLEAAVDAGIKTAIIPESNKDDVLLSPKARRKIEIITASNLYEVLKHALTRNKKKASLLKKIKRIV